MVTETPAPPRRLRLTVPPWLWPATKALLTVAVVAAVAWQFAEVLRRPGLWEHSLHLRPAWLAVAAALYLVGLGFPAFYWYRLLCVLGQRPRFLAALRAYYVGQLGRYVPGKVVGLGMRARLLSGPGVRPGVAVLTVAYESLTTITSGVLLGLVLLAWDAPAGSPLGWRGLALLAVVGVLVLPGVFNRLAERTSRPFRPADAPPLPRLRFRTLLFGLLVTGGGWLAQGGTLWALNEALTPGAWADPAAAWGRCTAYVALAYAAGFLVLAAPGGLGVRDYLIQHFLAADLARTLGAERAAAAAVVAALLLRLLWTMLDVAAAAACWWLPGQKASGGRQPPDEPPSGALRPPLARGVTT